MDYHAFLAAWPQVYLGRGLADDPHLCLTFDDGPGVATPAVLEALDQLGVTATFFCLGEAALHRPDMVRAIVEGGHEVGSHGHSHLDLRQLSAEVFARTQVLPSIRALEDITGSEVTLFRPPYGEISPAQVEWLACEGLTLVGWSVDPQDWADPEAPGHVSRVVGEITRKLHPGAIVLLHDGDDGDTSRASIVEILNVLVHPLRHKGYTFVQAGHLLRRRGVAMTT